MPSSSRQTLDPIDWASFRQQAHAMLDDMLGYTERIREQPVWQPLPPGCREHFAGKVPFQAGELSAVHDEFLKYILPYASGNAHPGFMGWVQGGGTPVGMLAEMLAAGLNANLGGRSHAPLEVEREVSEWMRQLFRFPSGASGLFVAGTSMANLTAVKVARDAALRMRVRREGLAARSEKLTAYASTAAHSCVPRAMDVCGLGSDALRLIGTNERHQIDVGELEARIEADRRAGFKPFLIVGNAGTVDIGAIDNLTALADLAERHRLWFHVDGAYAALAILAEDLAGLLDGVQRADSLAFDFHKWAQVPYSAGFLLVRDGSLQCESFTVSPAYLRREARGLAAGADWPCDFGVDLSRGFQALKTWFTFKVYGTQAMGATISRCCALARSLADDIARVPELELMAPVQLNIVCFRYRATQADRLNARIVIELQEAGEVAPSTTVLNGKLAIRAAIVNHRTQQRDVDLLIARTLSLGRMLTAQSAAASEDGEWEPHAMRVAELQELEETIENPQVRRADILAELGRLQEARDEYLAVLQKDPTQLAALNHFGHLLYGTGYRSAAQTVFAEAVRHDPSDAASLINLANVLTEEGEAGRAREMFAAALHLAPGRAEAHQGMARALEQLGEGHAAEFHRRTGFTGHSLAVLPYRGNKAPVKVLLLVAAAGGSPPVRHFLDDATFQTAVLTAEYFDAAKPLPPHHLVFNAIGDAELAERALYAAEYLLARTPAAVINPPRAVLATGRADNAKRLRDLPGVVTPRTVTLPKYLLQRALLQHSFASEVLARHGLDFPLLLRTPGFHTGQHFLRIESAAALASGLAQLPGSTVTAIQYLDARGPDGKSRKYRVMMIDGSLYPLHAAISSYWKIHYFTAEMAGHARHRAEDQAFLADMQGVLGAKAMLALENIQSALGLDYAGIDFGLNESGELLLFEANATMVVPRPDGAEKWAYRRPAVEAIHSAVRRMLLQRACGQACRGGASTSTGSSTAASPMYKSTARSGSPL